MTPIKKLKQELKNLAHEIKTNRPLWKESQRQGKYEWKYNPIGLANQFRYKHIAYCLLRGRTMEQIERSNREGNKPVMGIVEKIMKEVQDETLRYNESGPIEIATSSASGTCSSTVPSDASRHEVGQRNVSIPESPRPTFVDRAKEFLGIV